MSIPIGPRNHLNYRIPIPYDASGSASASPQLVSNPAYVQAGTAPFDADVKKVGSEAELKKQLERLAPGQYAILLLATRWCPACRSYKPSFESLAKSASGRHLFLMTDDKDDDLGARLAQSYGFPGIPSIVIFDHRGGRRPIKNRYRILEELSQFQSRGPTAPSQAPVLRMKPKTKNKIAPSDGNAVSAIIRKAKTRGLKDDDVVKKLVENGAVTVPGLIGALGFKDPHVRCIAAAALGEIGAEAKNALRPLEKMRKTDSNRKVKKAAKDAQLKIFKDQLFGGKKKQRKRRGN